MANQQHATLGTQPTKMHGTVWQTVANAAALAALVIVSDDVTQGKIVKQTDTGQYWSPTTVGAGATFIPVMPIAASQVNNDSAVAGTHVSDALNTLQTASGRALKSGGALPDANATVSLTAGAYFTLPGPNTADRTYTIDRLGLPATTTPGTLSIIEIDITDTSAHQKIFLNGGAAAGDPFIIGPNNPLCKLFIIDDGTNWNFQSQAQTV